MDPDAALQLLRRLARQADDQESYDPAVVAEEQAQAFEGLDNWLTGGGFLPQDWETSHKRRRTPTGIPPRRDWARDHDPDAPVPGKDFP